MNNTEKMDKRKKITVVGLGYVGMSMALLLENQNDITVYDLCDSVLESIDRGCSPVDDETIKKRFEDGAVKLKTSYNIYDAYHEADIVIISVPTDYRSDIKGFDTTNVEGVLEDIKSVKSDVTIVIKSTVPIGFSSGIRKKGFMIIYSPEFLRESHALTDNLHPSRIVVGTDLNNKDLYKKAEDFCNLLFDAADNKNHIERIVTGYSEAEAIKLFSNAYLAMRVAFFNELDTFSKINSLNSKQIIKGVCADKRIGNYYNNPSFGYGGYCLPKDTMQLASDFETIPGDLIRAIVNSNKSRKAFISEQIIESLNYYRYTTKKNNTTDCVVGIHRLIMKTGSSNFRNSSINDVIQILNTNNIEVVIYEPLLKDESNYLGNRVINNIDTFMSVATLIVTNRYDNCLDKYMGNIFTRDIYGRD